MRTIEKYLPLSIGLLAVFLLWFYLEKAQEFLFYYREQVQIFRFDSSFIYDRFFVVGGFSLCLSQFFVQFFCVPLIGSLITAVCSVASAAFLWLAFRKINRHVCLFALCFLPVLFQINALYDFYYSYQGLVSFCLASLFIYVYAVFVPTLKGIYRLLWGSMLSVVLFVLAGATALLSAVAIFFFELSTDYKRAHYQLLPVVLVLLSGFYIVARGDAASLRLALLNDAYYEPILRPTKFFLTSWILVVLVMLVFFALKRLPVFKPSVSVGCALVLFAGICWYCLYSGERNSSKAYGLFELQHYVVTEDWDHILQSKVVRADNYLLLNYANLALSHRGRLISNLFDYPQRGPMSLLVQGNSNDQIPELTTILADLYYRVGSIGAAQSKAFDSNVGIRYGNPSMVKLLVKTNLIFGAYAVAEKYISLLEKTWRYADWARAQRRFLYDDEAVASDQELGTKRKGLTRQDHFAFLYGPYADMLNTLEANPADTVARDYALAFLMLAKDRKNVNRFVERYAGTEILKTVPPLFQQAVMIMNENDPAYCRRYGVSENVVESYGDFRRKYLSAIENRRSAAADLLGEYGKSYWYYFLFKNIP